MTQSSNRRFWKSLSVAATCLLFSWPHHSYLAVVAKLIHGLDPKKWKLRSLWVLAFLKKSFLLPVCALGGVSKTKFPLLWQTQGHAERECELRGGGASRGTRASDALLDKPAGQNSVLIHQREASGFQCHLDAGKIDGAHMDTSPTQPRHHTSATCYTWVRQMCTFQPVFKPPWAVEKPSAGSGFPSLVPLFS